MAHPGTRASFGQDWSQVVRDWLLGASPPIPPEQAWDTLGILERLWPDYLARVWSQGARGYIIMLEVLDVGCTLAACESLRGFDGVLRRITIPAEERSALAEARFARSLVRLGYDPILDTVIRDRRPDAWIVADDTEVFVDVIAPQWADHLQAIQAALLTLGQGLLEWLSGQRPNTELQVHCLDASDLPTAQILSTFLDASSPITPGATHELPGRALLKLTDRLREPSASSVVPPDAESPILMQFGANGMGNSVAVSAGVSDERAELLLSRKLKQFSRQLCNLLVIDATGIPDGIYTWESLVRRRLQPELNRRVSGVLLLERKFNEMGVIIQECLLVRHPNPYQRLPEQLTVALGKLHGMPACNVVASER